MKIMNIHISQRNIILFVLLCIAIFISSCLGVTKEGFVGESDEYAHDNNKNDENNDNYYPNEKNHEEHHNKEHHNKEHHKHHNKEHHKHHNKEHHKHHNKEHHHGGHHKRDYDDLSKYNSYIGPAGDTVLYEDSHNHAAIKEHHKKRKHTSPQGIPGSQIPTGSEDLYILKSEIVPPVCPACPNVIACPNKDKPPPCPPCARCPEPSFNCKKVPNYNSNNSEFLPRPVLSDFSQFGM